MNGWLDRDALGVHCRAVVTWIQGSRNDAGENLAPKSIASFNIARF